ncbi:MAG: NAD-dependent epimerase/dehydratase family protein [Actinobacteria bacterium]|nr:NAD-dependent epimerase/dehydratase family protein [Actinomycetota bacterium]
MSTHLVVGAGPVGSEVARLLADDGQDVVVVTRHGSGPDLPGVRLVATDAASVDALLLAAPEASAIYNCANPAYHRWAQDWPPLAAAMLSYAERTGAMLAICSNLYGYGPVSGPMSEALPFAATGTKGRVRAQMWLDAKAAHDAGRIRATEVRGSDYICANDNSLIGSSRVVPRILGGKSVSLIGSVNAEHTWTAPADAARLLVTVAGAERGWGRAWHVPSNAPRTQRQVVDDLADTAGVPHVPVKSLPGAMVKLLGLFSPAIRELSETAYQRDRPFVVDDSAARVTFGLEPTPWGEILDQIIEHYRRAS